MITKLDTFGRPIYEPGDILAVANYNFLGRANQFLFMPRTFFYHYGLIDQRIESEDDYSIIESVNKGPTMGRLSWYRKKDYRIYRVNPDAPVFEKFFHPTDAPADPPLGQWAVEKASKFGRHGYDFLLFVKLFMGIVVYQGGRLIRFQKPERMTPDNIPYGRDKALVCTELVYEAWRAVDIILRASGHAPIPAEFELAKMRNEIIMIDSHWGKKGEPWRPHNRLYILVDHAKGETIADALENMGTTAPAEAVTMSSSAPAFPTEPESKAGPELIARQGGQKRNRVHVYRQPFGYPVRLCDWVYEGEIEPIPTVPPPGEPYAAVTCKHCLAVIQGTRRSMEDSGPPYNEPAGGGEGGVG